MNTLSVIKAIGGRKKVIQETGLHRASISHWVANNIIPKPWLKFFMAKYPKLDWKTLLAEPPPEKFTSSVTKEAA